jgi:hypothetical protein
MRCVKAIAMTMLAIILVNSALTALAQVPVISGIAANPPVFNSETGTTSIDYTLADVFNNNVTLQIINNSTLTVVRTIDGGDQSSGAHSIIWDGEDDFSVAVPEGNYTANLSVAITNATTPQFMLKWTATPSFYPFCICSDPSGFIYVADSRNDRVVKFYPNGTFITTWGTYGSGPGQFRAPAGVCSDASGYIYVIDRNNNRVEKFYANGTYIMTWGSGGSSPGQFNFPVGIGSDPSGNIYVADYNNNRIQKFYPNGTFILTWGTTGSDPGQFDLPEDVCSDPSGYIYTCERTNDRVQKFYPNGTFITTWGSFGYGTSQFIYPEGICSDPAGNIYVADTGNARIQKFYPDGTFITTWGRGGYGDGQFMGAEGVCSDPSGYIYATDNGNNRVQKFGYSFTINSSTGVRVDNTPPVVTSVSPLDSATNVPVTSVIKATFNQDMNASTINASTFLVRNSGPVAGTITYYPGNLTAVFVPSAPLAGSTLFTVNVTSGVADLAGNHILANYVWSFTTIDTTPPTVTSVLPVNGATGVPVSTVVKATFSKAMNASTINTSTFLLRNGGSVAGTVTYYAGNLTAVFVPSTPLLGNTLYTVNVTTGVADTVGNHMLVNYVWSFRTVDTTPPTVTSVLPLNGATGVPVSTVVKTTFSKAMNASTINTSTFLLRNGGSVAGSVTYYAGNLTAVFVPSAQLQVNTLYTANVTTGVMDTFGNHLAANYVWSFRTVTSGTPNASYVSDTIPASMVAGMSYNVNITMRNTGYIGWSEADMIRLGGNGDLSGDAAKFDGVRLLIAPGVTVNPGESYTWNFTMTAPATHGTYHPSYQMVWDAHQWFGSILNKTVTVVNVTPNAIVVSNTLPSSMVVSRSYPVSITMRNTGNVNWTAADLFRLGASGIAGGDAAKFGVLRVNISPGTIVQPGQSYTFSFTMTAPGTKGTYNPAYQMVWEGNQWFGGILTKTIVVSEIKPNSTLVSDTIPSSMARGSSHPVNVTMRNTGNANWTAADLYRLGAVGDAGGQAAKFGVLRVNISPSTVVQPGQSFTFSFTMIAPSTAGTYHPSYQMVWEGNQWFGAIDTKTITVT